MKWLKKVGRFFLVCLTYILFLVGLVLYILLVPFDWIRYRCSAFRKGTKQAYQLFLTDSEHYKIYNHLSKKGRSFQYFHSHTPYFILDGVVLFSQWSNSDLIYTDGIWKFYEYGNEDPQLCSPVTDTLAKCLASLPPEHQLLPARFLLFCTHLSQKEYSLAKECPCFECFDSIEDI